MVRRLNFGCGHVILSDWVNFDTNTNLGAGVITPDATTRPMGIPVDDNHFEIAVANHVLCAIPHRQVHHWLVELHRVMRPGGCVRILVPDLVAAFEAYRRHDLDWFPMPEAAGIEDVDTALPAYLTWFSENRSAFTRRSLLDAVHNAGFYSYFLPRPEVATQSGDPRIFELDSRLAESIVVEAVKPKGEHGT